jgi:type IV secretion system protein VirB1
MIDLAMLIDQCIMPRHKVVMTAIVTVESGGKPLAIGLNKGYRLKTQPKDENQAKNWVQYLEQNNYNFDVGLGQVNIKNIHHYGYKASDMLDPCLNLKISSEILEKSYQTALATSVSSKAIQQAISAYNTGNFNSGFNNGYVGKVNASLGSKLAMNDSDIPPIISTKKSTTIHPQNKISASDDSNTSNPYSSKTVMYVAPKKASAEEIKNASI